MTAPNFSSACELGRLEYACNGVAFLGGDLARANGVCDKADRGDDVARTLDRRQIERDGTTLLDRPHTRQDQLGRAHVAALRGLDHLLQHVGRRAIRHLVEKQCRRIP